MNQYQRKLKSLLIDNDGITSNVNLFFFLFLVFQVKTRSVWEQFHYFPHPNFKKLISFLAGSQWTLLPFLTCILTMMSKARDEWWNSCWRAVTHPGLFGPSKVAKISTTASKEHPVVAQSMTKNSYPLSRRSWHKEADSSQVCIGNSQLEELAICLLPKSRLGENPSSHLPWLEGHSFHLKIPCKWKKRVDPMDRKWSHQQQL